MKSCDKVTGACSCSLGYFGDLCQRHCPLGTYGHLCLSTCQCSEAEGCNFITGACFSRIQFVFYLNLQVGSNDIESMDVFAKFASNLEKLMAKYYVSFLRPVSLKRREIRLKENEGMVKSFDDIEMETSMAGSDDLTDDEDMFVTRLLDNFGRNGVDSLVRPNDNANINTDTDDKSFVEEKRSGSQILGGEPDVKSDRTPDKSHIHDTHISRTLKSQVHDINRRDVVNDSYGLHCAALLSPLDVTSFSVLVTSKEKRFTENGKTIVRLGLIAMYKTKPQGNQLMEQFLKVLPEECLFTNANCNQCSVFTGKSYATTPSNNSMKMWIIIGTASGK